MKTILVPTDFSKNAYCALYYATQLFKSDVSRFIIVHSFENQVSNLTSRVDIGRTEAVVDELYNTAELKCEEVKHKIILDNDNKNHSFEIIATSLSLPRAVNRLITKETVNFVVMGSKGATAASHLFMGSNTRTIVKKIKNASLLIVPQEMDFKPLKKVTYVTGFKRPNSMKELNPLLSILEKHDAVIKVAHIHEKEKLNDEQRSNVHELFEIFRPFQPELHWLQDENHKLDVIDAYLKKEGVDMLVMIYFKHNFLKAIFREAVVKNMAERSDVPFLILPDLD